MQRLMRVYAAMLRFARVVMGMTDIPPVAPAAEQPRAAAQAGLAIAALEAAMSGAMNEMARGMAREIERAAERGDRVVWMVFGPPEFANPIASLVSHLLAARRHLSSRRCGCAHCTQRRHRIVLHGDVSLN